MIAKVFGKFAANALGGETAGESSKVDWLSDTIKVALFTNAHAPDQDVDEFYDGAHGMTECAATGEYVTGGFAITNKTMAYDVGTNKVTLDGDPISVASSTITARYALIYDDTPASNKPLIAYLDFEEDKVSVSGTFPITWAGTGIVTLTAA